MSFLQILPALITLIIAMIGGLVAFNRQQVRFDGELNLLKQAFGSEKERINNEIVTFKLVNEHFYKDLEHTKGRMSVYEGDMKELKANILYIKETLKDLKDRKT